MLPETPALDFRSPHFLCAHVADTMAFYHPRAIDPAAFDADNRKYDDEKSPAGKTDHHTMGACHEVLNIVRTVRE
mgnify:CR=1 FL=1